MGANEVWRNIEGFQGFYQVSTFGNVRKVTNLEAEGDDRYTILKQGTEKSYGQRNQTCYKTVCFEGSQFKVHRLVANAFLPNPENACQVNHIDGNKSNNNLSNLEWVTASKNSCHAISTGLSANTNFVRCIEDDILFATHLSAAIYYGTIGSAIDDACRTRQPIFGKHFKPLSTEEVSREEEALYMSGSKAVELSSNLSNYLDLRPFFIRAKKAN